MDQAKRDELDVALEGDLALEAVDAEAVAGGGQTSGRCARCGHLVTSHQMSNGKYYCQTNGTHFCS